MRNHDRTSHREVDAEIFEHVIGTDASLDALRHVVADAVVAMHHPCRDQTGRFLPPDVRNAPRPRLRIEYEKAPPDRLP